MPAARLSPPIPRSRAGFEIATPAQNVAVWRRLHRGGAYFREHRWYKDRLHDLGVARIVEMLGPRPEETVLEVGCGYGRLLWHLAPRVAPGGRLIGIDLAEEPLAEAGVLLRGRGRADLHVGDGVTLRPVGDGYVDAALAFTVIQHMTRSGARGYMAELARVLRPGGRTLVQFHFDGGAPETATDITSEVREQSLSYSAAEAIEAVESGGLVVERVEKETLEAIYPGSGLAWWWILARRAGQHGVPS